MFEEMVGWAVEGGADLIIGETFYYAGEALAALEAAKLSGLPVVLTIAPMAFNEMADGVGIVETCQRLEQGGADVVGMNCIRGPRTMLPWLREIRAAVSCHVGALPIPYRTTDAEPTFFNLSDPGASVPSPHGRTFPTALDPLYANRYEVGALAREAAELGIKYLGVCCGASPMLIRQVAEAVRRTTEASRFSEKMRNHFMYGDNERLPDHRPGGRGGGAGVVPSGASRIADAGALRVFAEALVAMPQWSFLLGPGLIPGINALFLG